MRIHLLAVGTRMPDWVSSGYQEYAKRLPPQCALSLKEIPAVKPRKSESAARSKSEEGQSLLRAIPDNSNMIALDGGGKPWSTEELAEQLRGWMQAGRDMTLVVGGPEGLSDDCLRAAGGSWSLSRLTFPHPLVRVLVAEQLYRAWTILNNHPYHRGAG